MKLLRISFKWGESGLAAAFLALHRRFKKPNWSRENMIIKKMLSGMMQTKLKKAPSTPEKLMTMPYTIISKLKTNQNHPIQLHTNLSQISRIRNCQAGLLLNPCPYLVGGLGMMKGLVFHCQQEGRVRRLDGGEFLFVQDP